MVKKLFFQKYFFEKENYLSKFIFSPMSDTFLRNIMGITKVLNNQEHFTRNWF